MNLNKPGLHKLSEDKRDLSLGSIFSQIDIKDVPASDFVVIPPLKIKDQHDDDFCTAYTVTEVSEDQELLELCPDFQYAMSAKLRGDFLSWGMDLRLAFKSAVQIGSLPVKYCPSHDMRQQLTRDTLANWKNWDENTLQIATQYRKRSFFKVDGRYDLFDNIRAAMWQFRAENRTIGVGCIWRQSWINMPGGIISESYEEAGFGHAFKIFGQKVIDGELHLVAQLSNGLIGDNGIYYFKRSIVNREFKDFGQFMFQDMPKDTAMFYQKHDIQAGDSFLIRAFKVIKNILRPTYYL